MPDKIHHATFQLEHTYAAPIERVFAEFADTIARARWSAPANDALVYDQADFHEGGRDIFRCGPKGDLKFRGETCYHLIVPNQRVISSETLDADGTRLAVALTTLEFEPTTEGTHLKLTVQLASLAGPDMVRGYEDGNRSALEGLARHLAAQPAA